MPRWKVILSDESRKCTGVYNLMNLLGKLQNEYDQLWKYIIRPTRTAYS